MPANTVSSADFLALQRSLKRLAYRDKVSGGDIVAGSIFAAHLTVGDVLITGTAQIADAIITDAKIVSLSASKITAGTIVVSVDLGTGNIVLDGTVPLISVIDGTPVTRVKLGKIGADYGLQVFNASNVLMWDLTDGAQTAGIANLAVTTAKVDNLAVTTAKVDNLAVTTGKIDNLAVTNGKIGAAAVDTGKLASGAATATGTVTDNSSQNITPYDTDVQVATMTVTINATSDLVEITGRVQGTGSNIGTTAGSEDTMIATLKRGSTTIDTSPLKLTVSSGATIGGAFASAFTFHDTGISGSTTYNLFLSIHNGSGSGTFAVTKSSVVARVVDLRAQ